jgi:hypothetical protein
VGWVVRFEVEIPASVGGFPVDLCDQGRLFSGDRTSRKEIALSDSVSIVKRMEGLRLLRWPRKLCNRSGP